MVVVGVAALHGTPNDSNCPDLCCSWITLSLERNASGDGCEQAGTDSVAGGMGADGGGSGTVDFGEFADPDALLREDEVPSPGGVEEAAEDRGEQAKAA